MPMTKREQSAMDALRLELSEARALRFIGVPAPVRVSPPLGGRFNGWNFTTSHGSRVYQAWSESSFHGVGHLLDGGKWTISSQGAIALYATKLDALIALRIAKEAEFARSLAQIDRLIEQEREQTHE